MTPSEMDYESDLATHKRHKSCCSNCESQIFCSYVISILSSLLIAGGFYLTILKWDHLWLILPIVGSILIFIGACMYYSGQMDLKRRRNSKANHSVSNDLARRRRRRNQRGNKDRGNGDNLISSTLGDGRSLSQLSINMIPQYFANSDLPGSAGPASMPYSQILRVNGQSFLILPLTGETSTNPNDTAISLQNFMVKVPCAKNELQSKPEGSDIYKKMEDFNKRFIDQKNYVSTEGCYPSASVSHEERLVGLDNRATSSATGFVRETEPGSHSESHFISNYFCAPGTSTSFNICQPEAQTSRINNSSIRVDPNNAGSSGTNQHLSYVQSSLPTSSTSSTSSSTGPSSTRRPLLRRDTFNKDKPSVTIIKSTNQSDSVCAQETVIADPSASSSCNNRTDNSVSVSNSLRVHSSQPRSSSLSQPSQATVADPSVITQSNLTVIPNINSSSSTATNNLANSISGDSSSTSRHHPRDQSNNADETFIAMCGGNGGDGDNITFDETLIETGSATPPPSYEEVLSVDIAVPNARSSLNFDTL